MTLFDPARAAITAALDTAEKAYTAEIAARDAADVVKDKRIADLEAQLHPTPVPTPTPTPVPTPPPAAGTIFGMNLGSRTVAARLQRFGRVPMVKQFSLVDVARLVPEKRAQVCVPYDQTKLAAGAYDAQIVAHLKAQVAAGAKKILYTNWQEPDGELKAGTFTVDQWHAGNVHLAQLIKANGVKGVTFVAPCVIAPHKQTGMVVPDTWMQTPDDLGGADWAIWTWDDYGNPAGASKYGGDPYATPYPAGADIAGQQYDLLAKHGWKRWGVSEFNTPWRKNLAGGGDADHSGRIRYLDDYVKACMAAPIGPPEHMFLWEEIGNKYDQTFTVQAEFDWWKGWVAKSA